MDFAGAPVTPEQQAWLSKVFQSLPVPQPTPQGAEEAGSVATTGAPQSSSAVVASSGKYPSWLMPPYKGPQLWAYQASILKAARNYEG